MYKQNKLIPHLKLIFFSDYPSINYMGKYINLLFALLEDFLCDGIFFEKALAISRQICYNKKAVKRVRSSVG